MTTRAGDLTDRLVFERKTTSQGDSTSVSTQTTWAPLLTTWGRVETLSGADQLSAGKVTSENRISVEIRYRKDVYLRVGDRVTWRSVTWLIETAPRANNGRSGILFDAIIEFKMLT